MQYDTRCSDIMQSIVILFVQNRGSELDQLASPCSEVDLSPPAPLRLDQTHMVFPVAARTERTAAPSTRPPPSDVRRNNLDWDGATTTRQAPPYVG
jgi:hypothetical protein